MSLCGELALEEAMELLDKIHIYIYIYTQGVPGGMCQTSGECSLC